MISKNVNFPGIILRIVTFPGIFCEISGIRLFNDIILWGKVNKGKCNIKQSLNHNKIYSIVYKTIDDPVKKTCEFPLSLPLSRTI